MMHDWVEDAVNYLERMCTVYHDYPETVLGLKEKLPVLLCV